MEWTHVLTIVGTNLVLLFSSIGITITLFLWAKKEGAEDRRQIVNLINAIQQEMKDFHARLCIIEERNKGK